MRQIIAIAIVLICALGGANGQNPGKIDFAQDVQPIFKTHCIDCHGPKSQKNSLRLDRRRDAFRGGTINVIAPGNSEASHLYLRLVGKGNGPTMPPDGALEPEQINIIKAWIDQGAKWPDALAEEKPPTPPDPKAARMMEALRIGNRQAFERMLKDDANIAKLKGPGGSTPLMYAVLYGDAEAVKLLLDSGADPNGANDVGATALMWAVDDLAKTRLLIQRGADVNARSEDGRTPLLIASGRYGSGEVVKLLLEKKANPSTKVNTYKGPTTPLRQAAGAGDASVLRMLLKADADIKAAGIFPLMSALNTIDTECIDLLTRTADKQTIAGSLLFLAPPFGNPHSLGELGLIKMLLNQGADVKALDRAGRSALMLAVCSDTVDVETVNLLIKCGADVNAKSTSGQTALDFAKQIGQPSIVKALVEAGAQEGKGNLAPIPKPKPAASARAALERSLPLLQRADVSFLQKSGCVSCHHNTLTAMTVGAARKSGVAVDEAIARKQRELVAAYIDNWRERALQGVGIPGDSDTVGPLLVGLAVENHPPDPATDALAHYLKGEQTAAGHWRLVANRPPIESSEFEVTAFAMRAMQAYGPKARRGEYDKAILRAADWLAKSQPQTNADRTFQLLGLTWSGAKMDTLQKAGRDLLAQQRPGGGWAQIPSLASDAYATGQALVALKESGVIDATDAAYQRGMKYLLSTQLEDGSWYVSSRAIAFQPFFESGFPHGHDQWISAAATNWAAMALAHAAR